MTTASFLAVADIAAGRPLLKHTLLKKLDKCVSLRFPIALAALRNAIFNRLLPLAILLLNIFPPDILLFGLNLNQDVNCFADSNFLVHHIPLHSSMLLPCYDLLLQYSLNLFH